MVTISLCMIVKDEEECIENVLKCARKFADEIIVVDTGSTDRTKDIVKKYTNKVYDFTWIYDFSKARNFAFSKATMDYVMWIDADDFIENKDIQKILSLKANLKNSIDMVMMKYAFKTNLQDKSPSFVYYRERMFKRSKNYKFAGRVHEAIVPSGNIFYSNIQILHNKKKTSDPKRNLAIYNIMIDKKENFNSRDTFYYARELMYNKMYDKAIIEFKKVIADDACFKENRISACLDLYSCYTSLNDSSSATYYLTYSFNLGIPKPEVCCEMAKNFINAEDYITAIFWLKIAIEEKGYIEDGGFHNLDYTSYIPYIYLCVCYDRLGNLKEAQKYNNLAGKIKPKDSTYLYNKEYFKSITNLQNATNTAPKD